MFAFSALSRLCRRALPLLVIGLALAGCQTTKTSKTRFAGIGMSSRECLTRVMYFESNRSSEDGMLAVGTVVMNRHAARKYGDSVCAVIGAKNQFAPGVLSRAMTEPKSAARAAKVADQVLKGKRHPKVGKAEFFHTAGYEPGYNNMRYVSIEGGNAFYEKVKKGEDTGNLVRVARKGPRDIGDMIAVQETTMVAAVPVAVPPPVDAEVYTAPPPRQAAPTRTAASTLPAPAPLPQYTPAPPPAALAQTYEAAPQVYQQPGPELGWQVGPPGRVY